MVAPEDFLLSQDEIKAKYAGKGSPDYPTHHAGCGCSGCYASWTEWRGGHAAVENLRTSHAATLAARDAEIAKMREALVKVVNWAEPPYGARLDWACQVCHPNSDCLVDGFRCGYHAAIELLASPPAPKPDGETKPWRWSVGQVSGQADTLERMNSDINEELRKLPAGVSTGIGIVYAPKPEGER